MRSLPVTWFVFLAASRASAQVAVDDFDDNPIPDLFAALMNVTLSEEVTGNVQDDRAATSAHREPDRVPQHRGQAHSVCDENRALADGREQRNLVDLLKRVLAEVGSRDRTGNGDQRRVGEMGLGDGGHEVAHARAGLRAEDDARAAGNARIRVGHVAGGALVASSHVTDAAVFVHGVIELEHGAAE